eukprot:CAMPEP_0119051042 /NCGR_PEP_ID=MMETSP1177-20130426/72792_1 /TAXON_ID=2985 /ORGANISM="Ochromonas sp, Strain CCMP1899" /LENGTH=133 /DNA_ID=CAMNT_0007030115 /DNA_START=450 /DNA_END=851 /DNA_ORIENTATION=+
MGGDVETPTSSGTGNYSAGVGRYFKDENYIIPHSDKWLLSMASIGVDTNGSQFYVALKPMPQLNGRCVAFARLVEGEETLAAISKVFTFRGSPASEIVIENCGVIDIEGVVHNSIEVDETVKIPERKKFLNHV